jgi:hypothetical protein
LTRVQFEGKCCPKFAFCNQIISVCSNSVCLPFTTPFPWEVTKYLPFTKQIHFERICGYKFARLPIFTDWNNAWLSNLFWLSNLKFKFILLKHKFPTNFNLSSHYLSLFQFLSLSASLSFQIAFDSFLFAFIFLPLL